MAQTKVSPPPFFLRISASKLQYLQARIYGIAEGIPLIHLPNDKKKKSDAQQKQKHKGTPSVDSLLQLCGVFQCHGRVLPSFIECMLTLALFWKGSTVFSAKVHQSALDESASWTDI